MTSRHLFQFRGYFRCYRRYPPFLESDSIVIYSLDPNALVTEENVGGDGFAFPISEGKAFVCLKVKGADKFYPYAPHCFQVLHDSEKIMWPSELIYREGMDLDSQTSLSIVIDQLNPAQQIYAYLSDRTLAF